MAIMLVECRAGAKVLLLVGTGLRVIGSGRIALVIMFLRRVCGRKFRLAYAKAKRHARCLSRIP